MTTELNKCNFCGTTNLPGNASACSKPYGCMSCQDCLCGDCSDVCRLHCPHDGDHSESSSSEESSSSSSSDEDD